MGTWLAGVQADFSTVTFRILERQLYQELLQSLFMKNHFRRCLAAAALIALTAVLLAAADPAGTWKGSLDFNGTPVVLTFNLKTSGAAVSGTINSPLTEAAEIKDGKVDGDTVTFSSTFEYQGNPVKLLYRGKIDGDQITFTMGTEDGSWTADIVTKRST
jgi:hypothetical protein